MKEAEKQLAELREKIALLERVMGELVDAQEEITAAYDRAVRKLRNRAEERWMLMTSECAGEC